MVFLSPQFCVTNGSRSQTGTEKVALPVIDQVDLASTISVLMDIPIPRDNIGVVILPVVAEILNSTTATRRAVCSLADQLKTKLPHGLIHERLSISQKLHCEPNGYNQDIKITEELMEICKEAAENLSAASSDYGMFSMLSALVLLAILTAVFLYTFLKLWPSFFVECPNAVLLLTVFHVFSLCGSSFVEEEHQLWYYWVPLSYAVLLVQTPKSNPGYGSHVGRLGMMFVLHRVLREWNRTGDKWAHLPDVGDWIRQ